MLIYYVFNVTYNESRSDRAKPRVRNSPKYIIKHF